MLHNIKPVLLGIVSALLLFILVGHMKKVNFVNKSINFETPEKIATTKNFSFPVRKMSTSVDNQLDFDQVISAINSKRGTYSIYIKNLSTGEEFHHNPDEQYYGASLYKVPVALAVLHEIYAGSISDTTTITYLPEDFSEGSGSLPRDQYNVDYTVSDLLNKLLKDSDNSAQLMLTRTVAKQSLDQAFALVTPPTNTDMYVRNEGSAKDYAYVYEYLFLTALNKNDDAFIGQKNALYLLGIMKDTAFEDRISTGLLESDFSHKIGNWGDTGSWHDCGLAYTKDLHIVCLMSKNTTYEEIAEIGKLVGKFIEN